MLGRKGRARTCTFSIQSRANLPFFHLPMHRGKLPLISGVCHPHMPAFVSICLKTFTIDCRLSSISSSESSVNFSNLPGSSRPRKHLSSMSRYATTALRRLSAVFLSTVILISFSITTYPLPFSGAHGGVRTHTVIVPTVFEIVMSSIFHHIRIC